MGDSIAIEYNSLKGAIEDFQKLESSLSKRSFSTISLINESRGATYEAVNACYENLQLMEENLSNLVEKTKDALEQCGISFVETENELIDDYENLNK